MSAFVVFVTCMLLLWAAAMWALHREFSAQRHQARDLPPASHGPAVDEVHAAFWQDGALRATVYAPAVRPSSLRTPD